MTIARTSLPSKAADLVHQSEAPLLDGLRAYKARDMAPFSTPGHKQGLGADPELIELFGADALRSDIPLGGGVSDTHFRGEPLKEAEALAAEAWGADRSYFLVNGSSAGNHASLLASVRTGDKVIVARDLHKSLLVALILTGANPVYVSPEVHPELNVGLGIRPDQIESALDEHPDAKLVALVSPSYCGVASDLAGIAAVAHARGVPVHVDEAWGPEFHFHPRLPASAMSCGIDTAVISTHKVLGSLTQAAILNVRGPLVDADRIGTTVGMVNTTSPSVLILASIDSARRQMALQGEALLERAIQFAESARRRLQAVPGVSVLDGEQLGVESFDLTKLVVDVDGLKMTGYEAEDILRDRFGICPEMSDQVGLVFLVTIADSQRSIDRLVDAFSTISRERYSGKANRSVARSSGLVIAPGKLVMTPRDAFFANARAVPLAASEGEVSSELVLPYPPGIPVLAPGEVITAEKIAYLQEGAAHGQYISGPADPTLTTIRVVD